MLYKSIILFLIFNLVFLIKINDEEKSFHEGPQRSNIDEKNYVLDSLYPVGDVRRYGIYPDSLNNTKHPNTGKYRIQTLLDFAEESGIIISFPKGYYGANLMIDSRQNINFNFNQAEFSLVYITDVGGTESKNINFGGTLIVHNRFGTFNSKYIHVDSLILKTNKKKSLEKLRNKGCHIYKGTKYLKINYLEIDDFGSGSKLYRNNHAALAIDGQGDNPENIWIRKVIIHSSDRHGMYVTGRNHFFEEVLIENYGIGDTHFMSQMQDAAKEDMKILSGLWINRCNNTTFNKVTIKTKKAKQGFPLKLDEGKPDEPTFINELILDVPYEDELVVDDVLTNVLVKKISIIVDND